MLHLDAMYSYIWAISIARLSGLTLTFTTFLGNFSEKKFNWDSYSAQIPCGSKISSKSLYLARFSRYKHFCVLQFLQKIRKFKMADPLTYVPTKFQLPTPFGL